VKPAGLLVVLGSDPFARFLTGLIASNVKC